MFLRARQRVIPLCIALVTAGHPAFAEKPDSPGNHGKKNTTLQESRQSNGYFSDDHITLIRNYYAQSGNPGHCPPGLAKKNNGCQPPGQARKWNRGEPLPTDIEYYDLPSALLRELGRTPEGQKVVQVGAAVLLISIASGMVLDAYEIE